MIDRHRRPIHEEIFFSENEIIVSKTDTTGRILYANHIFCRVAEVSTEDVIGQPHSIIRHPDMPRAVFKLLWDTLANGDEIFAYVKNMSASGRFYWVLAHVTPSYNGFGKCIGYHSNRRVPSRKAIATIEPIYRKMLSIEQSHDNPKEGLAASTQFLLDALKSAGVDYGTFIWSIGQ